MVVDVRRRHLSHERLVRIHKLYLAKHLGRHRDEVMTMDDYPPVLLVCEMYIRRLYVIDFRSLDVGEPEK